MNLAISEWENFEKSEIWLAIINEINSRDEYITDLLRRGDPEKLWTDREKRARISELEWIKSLPETFIMDISLSQKEALANNEKEEQ